MAKKPVYSVEKFTVTVGQGVLGKDKKPFNPGIIMATSLGRPMIPGGKPVNWTSPFTFSIASLMSLLIDEKYTEITVVDEENVQFTIRK